MRYRWMGLAAALVAAFVAGAPIDALAMDQAKHDDIKELLQLAGILKRAQTMADAMLPGIWEVVRKANPDIPQSVLDHTAVIVRDELDKALPELEEPIIAIYDANFTDDEIKTLLAFYRSPVGQKLTSQQPQMLQEGLAIGKVWGANIGQRVTARLRDELQKQGYKL